MTKTIAASFAFAAAIAYGASPAFALQLVETKIDRNRNGTVTYHFAVKTDPGETIAPGEDFVTVYNFYGLVHGSVKSPSGWNVSSQEFGKTPTWEGYPAVVPVDIPGTPNLTWTPSAAIEGGTEVDGFSATTRVGATTVGMYSAQVTRGESDGDSQSKPSKQAMAGEIKTPHFLAK
jgi:hypothetical protein